MIYQKRGWGGCPRCGSRLQNVGFSHGGAHALNVVQLVCPNHGFNIEEPKKRRKRR